MGNPSRSYGRDRCARQVTFFPSRKDLPIPRADGTFLAVLGDIFQSERITFAKRIVTVERVVRHASQVVALSQ